MPKNVQEDTNVQVIDNGDKIKHTNEQSQVFPAEDYVQVYNDTLQNLHQLRMQLERIEDQIGEIMEEKNAEMGAIHTLIEDEPQEEPETLEVNAITGQDLQDYQELQQQKEQREQLLQQQERLESQIESMKGAVERIADEDEIKSMEDFETREEE